MSLFEEQALSDFDRSNKGASKQRRDQINAEISVMRDLLPLPESSRHRLSQLQIMSLTCVYIRKCNVLQKLFHLKSSDLELPESVDFFQAMTGFLLVATREGKLLYISENVTDYLGHSMVDMKTQGDSLYDIVDKRDHSTLQLHLLQGGPQQEHDSDSDVSFFCRMNMSRTLKRQPGFGDVKVMHVRGHFMNMNHADSRCSGDSQCVFMATCSPLITPDVKENLVQNNTMVFKTFHKLDMTIMGASKNCEYHLGCTSEDLSHRSWYSMLHPEDIQEAKEKHTQLIRSNHEISCMITVRLIRSDGSSIWVNIVMHLQQAYLSQNGEPHIVCINQVIDAHEAYKIKVQGHMFSVYQNRPYDMWGGNHLMPFSSPVQNNTGSQWMPQHVSNAVPVSEHAVNIPSYIDHAGCPDMFNNTTSSIINSNNKPITDFSSQSQSSFLQRDNLKAVLKRKIQEPQSKSSKLARMSWNTDSPIGGSACSVTGNEISEIGQYNQASISSHSVCKNQMMQVLQPNKMSSKHKTNHYVSNMSSMNLEQIVPESYLTPDPSPVSSPQSSCPTVKTEMLNAVISTQGKSSVNILHALEKLATSPYVSTEDRGVAEREKELPVLDPVDIDSFFDIITGESEFQTTVRAESQIKHYTKRELKTEQMPAVNIPNFAALKDESLSPSPCLLKQNQEVFSNIQPSSKSKIRTISQVQLQPSCTLQPQIQIQLQTSSHSAVQSQIQLSSQLHVQSQIQLSSQLQVQFQKQPTFHIKVQPQVNKSTSLNSYIPTSPEAPIMPFPCPDFPTDGLELHSNYDYSKDMYMSNTHALSPMSVTSSSESVTSPETIGDILNSLSDDSLDQIQSDAKSSISKDLPDIASDMTYFKSFHMENLDCDKLLMGNQRMSEELSPQSSISSLEDDRFDDSSLFALEKALNDLDDQMLLTSSKDQDVLGMSDDLSFDFILNSWMPQQGSLDMIKHSQ